MKSLPPTISFALLFLLLPVLKAQDFEDVASDQGVNALFGFGNYGGGVSFSDFNGDGWDDLTLGTQQGDSIHFFVNDGGNFTGIPSLAGHTDESKQLLWVDYDNDGDKDLFVCSGDMPNRLYNNTGDLVLVDVTAISGLPIDSNLTYGATFGDYDNDGWLDLYVCNYISTRQYPNRLYHNNADGSFTDVSLISQATDSFGFSFCAIFLDYNMDGWQDIYVANDKTTRNYLFENQGDGTFEEVGSASGAGIVIDAMNAGGADYDSDGDYDLYITNAFDGNVLLRNDPDGTFEDVTDVSGTVFYRFGWAANFFDYDNDSDLDLYVSSATAQYQYPNAMYVNDGTGVYSEPFRNTGGLDGVDYATSYSNSIGDYNRDGRPDIASYNYSFYPLQLWENREYNDHHYLRIRLEGSISNRDGIGSWIEVRLDSDTLYGYTHCGEGFMGQNSQYEHFGLGADTIVNSICIRWLSGIRTYLYDVPVDTTLHIVEPSEYPLNDCDTMVLSLADSIVSPGRHSAIDSLSARGRVSAGDSVLLVAGETVFLHTDFRTDPGATLSVMIIPCDIPPNQPVQRPASTGDRWKFEDLSAMIRIPIITGMIRDWIEIMTFWRNTWNRKLIGRSAK